MSRTTVRLHLLRGRSLGMFSSFAAFPYPLTRRLNSRSSRSNLSHVGRLLHSNGNDFLASDHDSENRCRLMPYHLHCLLVGTVPNGSGHLPIMLELRRGSEGHRSMHRGVGKRRSSQQPPAACMHVLHGLEEQTGVYRGPAHQCAKTRFTSFLDSGHPPRNIKEIRATRYTGTVEECTSKVLKVVVDSLR